jgi:MFS family permease
MSGERKAGWGRLLAHAMPFVTVYGVVWGVAGITLPLRAGLVFAMLNLGVALGAPLWGHLSRTHSVTGLIFLSTGLAGLAWLGLTALGNTLLPLTALVFGLFSAGTFALATVQVTNIFPRETWDSHIADMQSLMVGGQVVGLLATSVCSGPALGIPFLVGFVTMICTYAFVALGMNDGVVAAVSGAREGDVLGIANALMSIDNVVGGIGFVLSVIALLLGGASAAFRRRLRQAAAV